MVAGDRRGAVHALRGGAAMTFPEFTVAVTVALAVVAIAMAITGLIYIVIVSVPLLYRLPLFRRLRCLDRGHAWITVTVGQIGVSESYTRHRVCGCCGRREEVTR
jgi:hypothetical protein